jgi:hypothetical protein
MKIICSAVAAIFFIFAIAGIATGAEKRINHRETPTKTGVNTKGNTGKEKTKFITGIVTAIDMNKHTISVKGKDMVKNIAWNEKTTIQSSGQNSIWEIKVGDSVNVKYTEEGGKKFAKRVSVKIKRQMRSTAMQKRSMGTTRNNK